MRVYYRGPDAVVTSDVLIWRGAATKSFTISDMRNVCVASETATGPSRYVITGFLLSGVLVAAWFTTPWVLLVALACGPLIVRRRSVRWELRADYRGRSATLYSSADSRVFNQVSRALRRAIEMGGAGSRPEAAA